MFGRKSKNQEVVGVNVEYEATSSEDLVFLDVYGGYDNPQVIDGLRVKFHARFWDYAQTDQNDFRATMNALSDMREEVADHIITTEYDVLDALEDKETYRAVLDATIQEIEHYLTMKDAVWVGSKVNGVNVGDGMYYRLAERCRNVFFATPEAEEDDTPDLILDEPTAMEPYEAPTPDTEAVLPQLAPSLELEQGDTGTIVLAAEGSNETLPRAEIEATEPEASIHTQVFAGDSDIPSPFRVAPETEEEAILRRARFERASGVSFGGGAFGLISELPKEHGVTAVDTEASDIVAPTFPFTPEREADIAAARQRLETFNAEEARNKSERAKVERAARKAKKAQDLGGPLWPEDDEDDPYFDDSIFPRERANEAVDMSATFLPPFAETSPKTSLLDVPDVEEISRDNSGRREVVSFTGAAKQFVVGIFGRNKR